MVYLVTQARSQLSALSQVTCAHLHHGSSSSPVHREMCRHVRPLMNTRCRVIVRHVRWSSSHPSTTVFCLVDVCHVWWSSSHPSTTVSCLVDVCHVWWSSSHPSTTVSCLVEVRHVRWSSSHPSTTVSRLVDVRHVRWSCGHRHTPAQLFHVWLTYVMYGQLSSLTLVLCYSKSYLVSCELVISCCQKSVLFQTHSVRDLPQQLRCHLH